MISNIISDPDYTLGLFKDNVNILRKAIKYIER